MLRFFFFRMAIACFIIGSLGCRSVKIKSGIQFEIAQVEPKGIKTDKVSFNTTLPIADNSRISLKRVTHAKAGRHIFSKPELSLASKSVRLSSSIIPIFQHTAPISSSTLRLEKFPKETAIGLVLIVFGATIGILSFPGILESPEGLQAAMLLLPIVGIFMVIDPFIKTVFKPKKEKPPKPKKILSEKKKKYGSRAYNFMVLTMIGVATGIFGLLYAYDNEEASLWYVILAIAGFFIFFSSLCLCLVYFVEFLIEKKSD